MKKVLNNNKVDIFELNTDKNDIMEIILVENAKIMCKEDNKEYSNSHFLKITNRKGDTRVLDLVANIDITNVFDKLEILYSKKTKEKPIFIGQ